MKVFLSHTSSDKDVVKAIGAMLKSRGFDVWLDAWSMTPGDSLVEKIGEGINSSDRLVVFLSPESVESNWVKREVATGVVMELAEDKGLGEKFVVPALLTKCRVPIMLRDKLYADFTNKAFDAACEELIRGITSTPQAPSDERFENGIVRKYQVAASKPDRHAIVVEFAVRISPTEGLHVGVGLSDEYEECVEWFAPPKDPNPPAMLGGTFLDSGSRRESMVYARKFSSPSVTSTKSYYIRFEGLRPLEVEEVRFLDFHDRTP